MIQRGSQSYPLVDGGIYTLAPENEAYRLVSARVSHAVAPAGAASTPQLTIRDGAGNTIMQLAGTPVGINTTAQVQWISGASDFVALIFAFGGGVVLDQMIWLPTDLWIQPQWEVTIAPSVWGAGDAFGPLVIVRDSYPRTKGLPKRAPKAQDAPP